MTIKQAINVLRGMETYLCSGNPIWRTDLIKETVSMACEALEQADTPQKEYKRGRLDALNELKAYIREMGAYDTADTPQTDCGWK